MTRRRVPPTKRTTPTREVRTFRNVEVRAIDGKGPNGRPIVELRIIKPGIVDDYGSVWLADTFDEVVGARIAADADDTPSLCWAHRWDDPIAHGIRYTPDAGGPLMQFEYDDFEAVPRARQAHAQVGSKTIRDCSVGFFALERREATAEDKARWPGAREVITKSDLDEVSLVLRGAVPGAKVVDQRSGAMVDVDAVVEIARRKVAGELSDEEAREAIELLGGVEQPAPGAPPDDDGDVDDIAALDAEADALLDGMDGLGRFTPAHERRFVDRMTSDVRELLYAALNERYSPGSNQWIWVRDFSDVSVVFDLEGFPDAGSFRLDYTVSGATATLADGPAVQVVTKTTYVDQA